MTWNPLKDRIVMFHHDDGTGGGRGGGGGGLQSVDDTLIAWDGRSRPDPTRINVHYCASGLDAQTMLYRWRERPEALDGVAVLLAMPEPNDEKLDPEVLRALDGVGLILVPEDTKPWNVLERVAAMTAAPEPGEFVASPGKPEMDPVYGEPDFGVGPRDRDTWLRAMKDAEVDD